MRVELCTLDETVRASEDETLVILIDIEGGELDALRGATGLVASHRPLIIFEYNATTRKYFQLSRIAVLLGADYELYRLRSEDGRLDGNLASTWNVVALPKQGPWQGLRDHPGLIVE